MKALKISGFIRVGSSEIDHLQALQYGADPAATETTYKFVQYDGAVMKDTTCTKEINHEVALVGYSTNYILIKNSWS